MIVSFAYEDLDAGWTLEEVRFDALNLLVGPSGAGKSRILEALLNVRRAAFGGVHSVPSAHWRLVVEGIQREAEGIQREAEATRYVWEAKTKVTRWETPLGSEVVDHEAWLDELTDAQVVSERIERSGELLVERENGRFSFKSELLQPKLKEQETAVDLLNSDESVWPLWAALRLWRSLEAPSTFGPFSTLKSAESSRQRFNGDLNLLRQESIHPFTKLYILQQDHPELFERIVGDFADIFPTVETLKIATYSKLGAPAGLGEDFIASHLAIGMREEGVQSWVLHSDFSSGMAKTLTFLIETALAPKGVVFLIDELENSLGVNCLPDVARRMLKGLDRVQYVATSHHPRVINEIPFDRWKLVTRRGSRVRVVNARDIASLERASSLEKFTELINLPQYVEGVA